MRFSVVVAIGVVLILPASTEAVADSTLCHQPEEIVFSCPVGQGKMVSVCALSAGNKIAYRFGNLAKTDIEISADVSARQGVVEYNQTPLGRAYDMFVRFKSGKYAYVVQQRWDGCPLGPEDSCSGEDSFFAGVLVYKSGKQIAKRMCSGARESLDSEILSRLRVPTTEDWPK